MSKIKYDFGSGRSDPSTFPVENLKAAAVKAIENEATFLTEYPGNLGHEGMRIAMAQRESEREGVEVDPNHLLLTNGSMQGVTLSAETLQDAHGDRILIEEFSYPGTLSAYRNLKFDMQGIELDESGMRPDKVEEALERGKRDNRMPKFIYTISTYQNPTGFVMPKSRRLELIDLGKKYGVPIIEDNCYADVHYEGPMEPALYALDDDPNIIYLCSLSKILAPGFRLGYIYSKPPMLERLLARRSDAGSNSLAAAITAEFYKDGVAGHAKVANPVLHEKRDLTLRSLEANLGDTCVWSQPVGGLFIWVRIPDDVDRSKLWSSSREEGVAYLPGQSFHYARKDVAYLRLAFGHLTPDQISEGIPVLARCLNAARTSNESRQFESLF